MGRLDGHLSRGGPARWHPRNLVLALHPGPLGASTTQIDDLPRPRRTRSTTSSGRPRAHNSNVSRCCPRSSSPAGRTRACTPGARSKASAASPRRRSGWRSTAARNGPTTTTPPRSSGRGPSSTTTSTDAGPADWPRVRYEVRDSYYAGEFRAAEDWPLPEAEYRRFYLGAGADTLSPNRPTPRRRSPTTASAAARAHTGPPLRSRSTNPPRSLQRDIGWMYKRVATSASIAGTKAPGFQL
ncbi:CocE/NonD family hydrolase C-terminal non-catalytic domain-containing protein [Streptomyces sp. NPDC019990]|uniref:CocE/NonD family hydrolase C-terminal non-catalytic domain-containing protein n=1 Tax=Streptomyces sp. NPDC019990 TaxID=3154693 RepID=UPI0033E84E26